MKYLITLLLSTLVGNCYAQETVATKADSKAPPHKYELSITSGIALDENFEPNFNLYIGNTNNISFYKNFKRNQIGIGIDVDIAPENTWLWLVAPHLILNRTIELNKTCYYAGIMAGYASMQHGGMNSFRYYKNTSSKGFIAGIQAGMIFDISKHLAINTEACIRYSKLWNKAQYPIGPIFLDQTQQSVEVPPMNFTNLYFQCKLGLRYRF